MSDLDKAIRDDLGQRARDTAPEADARSTVAYADAIRSVLDLHTHTNAQHGLRICAACGLISRNSWCDTVSAIADDLGVSSQDTPPPPRPEPRVWRDRAGDLWRELAVPEPVLVLVERQGESVVAYATKTPKANVERAWGPLTEVLPSVSTVTDGRDQ